MSERPSILFLMSDEHRADLAGFAGNDVVRTPALDHLAETGIVFRNAYTPSPITVPTMQCLMAGQLPKTCGCEGWIALQPGYETFPRVFARHAYAAVACGRIMMQGPDQMQGWVHRIGDDAKLREDYITERVEAEFAQHLRPFADYKWSDAKEIARAGIGRAHNRTSDDYTVLGARNYIDKHYVDPYYDREQPDRPLLLRVGLLQPHYPYIADADRFRYYLPRVQPYRDQEPFDHPFLSQRQVRPGIDASHREIRRAAAAYYAMVETIDDLYGQVLEALEFAGQDLDEWIIVYCSDHGEMLGEHGIWEKQKFFEGSVHVPLIVRWPARFPGGGVVEENVSLCDLFATLCDLAGLPIPAGLDSRSLVPLMEGDPGGWRNEVVSQFGLTNVMIKRDHLKYQYYGPDMPEVLFDLSRDPGESANRVDDPAYANDVRAFRARLAALGHGPDADPDYVNAGYT
jgi:choline-sulfatase